ncbi:hypothetical protein SAMN05192562_11317 [Kosakonia arachidis]|uniref:Uncharacterized protein n=1 Tax=Kosakonia arachidis TaxID=551989 RepID=A0A1I7E9F4_9ENTR|nr:hypothetical protein SAMN05192562_11317 [Kosakonia arachidis]
MQLRIESNPGDIQDTTHCHDTPYSKVFIDKAVSVGLPCKVLRALFQDIPFFFSAFQLCPELPDLTFGFQ